MDIAMLYSGAVLFSPHWSHEGAESEENKGDKGAFRDDPS